MNPITDKIAMLLSTDWFFGKWHLWGLQSAEDVRRSMQQRCRSIVLDLLAGESDYWEVSFTEERLRRTFDDFFVAATESKMLGKDIDFLRQVASETVLESQEMSDISLLEILTQMLVSDLDSASKSGMPRELISKIAMFFEDLSVSGVISECENPKSDWDKKIRDATADMPTRLGDFLLAVREQRHHFIQFWERLVATTSREERNQLRIWYNNAAFDLFGSQVDLPTNLID
ncbi:hypothetical protein [Collimonas humicola]|uniref:hypothetical protein n=1 Tax=Collimonas humicola TaxID=2825886 RepID=UPI001B8B6513|nr:hypothetical protein [Collimonas humicola]